MRQLADVHKVAGHARHYFAGLMIIKKAVWQCFKMPEHFASHLCLHLDAHDMPFILNKIIEQHTDDVYHKKSCAEGYYHGIIALGDKLAQHFARMTQAYQV